TLEDPVERTLEDVIQIQINETANINYESGLKAILRHDPDVILIGEIRDAITAKYAFRAALTGHLVLTIIHANNGKGTLERLNDIGISELDIKQTVKSIICLDLLFLSNFKEKRTIAANAAP